MLWEFIKRKDKLGSTSKGQKWLVGNELERNSFLSIYYLYLFVRKYSINVLRSIFIVHFSLKLTQYFWVGELKYSINIYNFKVVLGHSWTTLSPQYSIFIKNLAQSSQVGHF